MSSLEARVSLVPLAVDAEAGPSPPAWARGAQPTSRFWYFANAHGEPWVARREGDRLLVSGAELGWRQLYITPAEAPARLAELLVAPAEGLDLEGGLHLGREEALWLAAVIAAAFPRASLPKKGPRRPPNAWSGWTRRAVEIRRP